MASPESRPSIRKPTSNFMGCRNVVAYGRPEDLAGWNVTRYQDPHIVSMRRNGESCMITSSHSGLLFYGSGVDDTGAQRDGVTIKVKMIDFTKGGIVEGTPHPKAPTFTNPNPRVDQGSLRLRVGHKAA